MDIAPLPTEVDSLQQMVRSLQQALEDSHRQITLLRQKLDALARRMFGVKSEQLDPAQLQLLLSGLAQEQVVEASVEKPAPAAPTRRPASRSSQRVRTPENLEVVRQIIEPDEVKTQPDQWKRIGQEVSRLLDYQPGKFFWQETVRPKYVRVEDRQEPPVIAPAPERVSDGCMAAPGLLAQLLVGKFADHVPYFRQQGIFWQRHGVYIARQQMVQWTGQSVRLLSGIDVCIRSELQESPYVQVDETPVRYQDPEIEGRCAKGFLWTGLVPGKCVVYDWHASRAAGCLESLLGKNYAGRIQCDGYSAYPAFAKDKKGVELIGCMAHVRRGFFEAQAQAPKVAGWILNQMGILYEWERELRKSRAGPAAREALRASHSRMVMGRLKRALEKVRPRYLPESSMGEAISYAINQWEAVAGYLEHGEAEIDNNLVENAIRPTAVGKKNWLFFGSEEAGKKNAVIYTLIANCRMHDIDPYAYLKDVLERLPTTTNREVAQLTPLNWKKARQVAHQQAA